MARLIDRLIRNPEAEWEDVMVMPLNIITRQSTDIYANNDPHIAEVLRYIHENISQKITVDDLVKLVPLSRRLLETRFKKGMGTSIYDYIIQTRIEKMMQLLCEGLSVSERPPSWASPTSRTSRARSASSKASPRRNTANRSPRKGVSTVPQTGVPPLPFRAEIKIQAYRPFLRRIYYLRGKLTFKPNLCP